jgi:hypothetical protein
VVVGLFDLQALENRLLKPPLTVPASTFACEIRRDRKIHPPFVVCKVRPEALQPEPINATLMPPFVVRPLTSPLRRKC